MNIIEKFKLADNILFDTLKSIAEPEFLTKKEKTRMRKVKEEKLSNQKAILWLNLIKEAGEYMNRNNLRYGQSVFNTAHRNFPDEVASLAGTDKDCFYDDSKTGVFLEALIDIVGNEYYW